MMQEITEEERRLAEDPPLADDLGDDADAEPADQFDQEPKDVPLLVDQGGFQSVLDDDLQELELNQPGQDGGEVV